MVYMYGFGDIWVVEVKYDGFWCSDWCEIELFVFQICCQVFCQKCIVEMKV